MNIFRPSTWFKPKKEEPKPPVYIVTDFEAEEQQQRNERPEKVSSSIMRADMAYNSGLGNTKVFYPSEYNLHDVASAYDADGYFRRAVDKYVDLIWRNGFELIGDNKGAVNYVKARLEQIAEVTGTPTRQLFEDISQNLVLYSNAFILKARNRQASGGRVRTTFNGKRLAPVAGYFVTDTPNMWIARNEHGKVLKYKSFIPTKEPVEFMPDNVLHMYYDKKPGTAFGTPISQPVLGDLEALRKMEENIELLVFQHAIPFFEYVVGNDDHPADDPEIAKAAATIRNKPVHGVFVHSGRNKLEVVGAKNSALDAKGYLEHYKKRIWAGLGMSAVAYGEGDTSNRSTAQTMNLGLQDTVKRFQDIIKMFVNEGMIKELLAEGGYVFNAYNLENKVELFIPEIDIDTKIKKENHYTDLMLKNMVTHDEARKELGRDPFVPADWAKTNYELVEIPTLIISAGDEEYSGKTPSGTTKAKASATGNSTSASKGGGSVDAKERPRNQYKALKVKPSIALAGFADSVDLGFAPKSNIIKDEIGISAQTLLAKLSQQSFENSLNSHYLATKEDIILVIEDLKDRGSRDLGKYGRENIEKILALTTQMMVDASARYIIAGYRSGVDDASVEAGLFNISKDSDVGYLRDRIEKYVARFTKDIKGLIESKQKEIFVSRHNEVVAGIFESMKFRLAFLARTELMKAYNIGKVRVYIQMGMKEVQVNHEDGSCSKCRTISKLAIDEYMNFDSVPPFHPECICVI